jgi:hypothetical protein
VERFTFKSSKTINDTKDFLVSLFKVIDETIFLALKNKTNRIYFLNATSPLLPPELYKIIKT